MVDDIVLISDGKILRFFNALVQRDNIVLESEVALTAAAILM